MRKLLTSCLRDEHGNEVIEYALLLGLVVIGTILLMGALGIKVAGRWQNVVDLL